MYFKSVIRKNPHTDVHSGYYRLVESYRNNNDRICHRTILNVGFLDGVPGEKLNVIQKILTEKIKNSGNILFEHPEYKDSEIKHYVEVFYKQICEQNKLDILPQNQNREKGKDYQLIDVNSIKNKDVREVGAEWLTAQALEQLQLSDYLKNKGWKASEIEPAQTHIISRAVYPASELATARWIKDNSGVCEITGYDIYKINKDKLYRIAGKLFQEQAGLEEYLSTKTNELFDINDKIVLYDLTNTYFEGQKKGSNLAKFGRSKEKRSDAKLVVLGLVINPQGFIKYSSIMRGNIADSKTLSGMIDKLRINTSKLAKKALVVIDAGIATEDNLKLILEKGYDYLCVNRINLKQYSIEDGQKSVIVRDNKKQKIELQKVNTEKNNDYYLKVHSSFKEYKERAMNEQFRERFEQELEKISLSLTKKGGVKKEDKVHQRIGRLKQKYPSIQRYFEIDTKVTEKQAKKTKRNPQPKITRIVTELKWSVKEKVDINSQSGIYFLRTSLEAKQEELVWEFYNTIREIEATFRVLKTDLDLRPIYHKTDSNTMAHLHLGLLAYWAVNTVRFQLKQKGIKDSWKELVRKMNTQKIVTTTAQNKQHEVISIRRCSEPNKILTNIYDALGYKYVPFVRKKSVVHKSDFLKNQKSKPQEFT